MCESKLNCFFPPWLPLLVFDKAIPSCFGGFPDWYSFVLVNCLNITACTVHERRSSKFEDSACVVVLADAGFDQSLKGVICDTRAL